MRVDHGCSYIFVAQKLLYGSDVVTVFQQVSSKAVAERVTTSPFVNAAPTYRLFDCFLQYPLANMMSVDFLRPRLTASLAGWKYKLPGPFAISVRVLLRECIRQQCAAKAFAEVPLMDTTNVN